MGPIRFGPWIPAAYCRFNSHEGVLELFTRTPSVNHFPAHTVAASSGYFDEPQGSYNFFWENYLFEPYLRVCRLAREEKEIQAPTNTGEKG
jgi:hypothetical protein